MTMQAVADAYREAVRRCFGKDIVQYSSISYRDQSFYIGLARRDERGSVIPPGLEYIYTEQQVIEMTQALLKQAEQQEQAKQGIRDEEWRRQW